MQLQEILAKDRWIIDGNYLRTMEARIAACDTIFLLDYPVELCLEGVEERIGKPRTDMPWVETEFDEEFRQWILDFPEKQLLKIYELLEKYSGRGKEIMIFRKREEAEEFLQGREER